MLVSPSQDRQLCKFQIYDKAYMPGTNNELELQTKWP